MNPTFSIDFKKNVKEDWNTQYQSRVVEKLQRCKFHMHWFTKQASATGYDNEHEEFFKLVQVGDIDKVLKYLRTHDSEQVLKAVEKGSKKSALHIAAKFGFEALIEFFLNREANVDARDKLLKTPLMYACEYGKSQIVNMLLKRGASILD